MVYNSGFTQLFSERTPGIKENVSDQCQPFLQTNDTLWIPISGQIQDLHLVALR